MEEDIKSMADRYMFNTYSRYPITIVKGKGTRVWDHTGKEFIDFVAGIAVCALGHSSSVVTEALSRQSRELVHVSNLYYTKPQVELARVLVENSFADRVFFCNSGAEANEAAIKLARKYSHDRFGDGRHVIISMANSFHGRTMATISATGQSKVKKGFSPLLDGFRFVPFNDIDALKMAIDDTVCAVILEPIQGEGGVVCPEQGYLEDVRGLCSERNILLILDEVQVGMGRTGRLFAHQHFNIKPDIMTLAKALGNGLPIGAMLSTEDIASSFGPGTHASTFGGTPLVSAVAKAVVETIINDGWIEHTDKMGRYFLDKCQELKSRYHFIRDVRGLGLIIGMELDRPAGSVVEECMKRGLLINCTQDRVLRFIPPLIIQKEEIDILIENLDDIFSKMAET